MDLLFSKIQVHDLPFLCRVRNAYAEDFLHDSRTFTIDETIEWFKNTDPNYWIINEGELRIGYFRLSNYSKINRNIYIGADVAPEFRGMGYAKRSYELFIPQVFEKYQLNKISLEVLSTNHIALNLYRKLGFFQEGIKREEVFKKGTFVDSIVMSILKQDYYAGILENKQ